MNLLRLYPLAAVAVLAACTMGPSPLARGGAGAGEGEVGVVGQALATAPTFDQLSIAPHHGCGIRNGALFCWGYNAMAANTGTTLVTQVGTATDWTAVATGQNHTCGIHGGGVYCFGANGSGQLGSTRLAGPEVLQVGTQNDWTAIAAGLDHTCAIRAGALYCWGRNDQGQLGDASTTARSTPTLVSGAWSKIFVGEYQTCGVRTDPSHNGLWCWGENASGSLGIGVHGASRLVPNLVNTDTTWTQVSLFGLRSCGIKAGELYCTANDLFVREGTLSNWQSITVGRGYQCGVESGALYCWGGTNTTGNLGTGDTVAHTTPTRIGAEYSDWSVVDSQPNVQDYQYVCALRNGFRYCWGLNQGFWGDGTTANQTVPTIVLAATTTPTSYPQWDVFVSGSRSMCGIKNGALYCGGSEALGVNLPSVTMTQVDGSTNWTAVAIGSRHTCAIRGGALYCFGSNSAGQLGRVGPSTTAPEQIGTSTSWTAIAASLDHTCGITNYQLYCWGTNTYGELGNNSTTASSTPVPVGTPGWSQVFTGNDETCGLRGGQLWCWGKNHDGALGLATQGAPQLTPAQVGTASDWTEYSLFEWKSCGVRGTGLLYCTTPQGSLVQVGTLTHWRSVHAGRDSVCALESGSLYCWGNQNQTGNLGTGDLLFHNTPQRVGGNFTDWSAVAMASDWVEYQNACALRQGGIRYCWGFNQGNWGDGDNANQLVPALLNTPVIPYNAGDAGVDGGTPDAGSDPVPSACLQWDSLSTGAHHGCGIRAGALYCWGVDPLGSGSGTIDTTRIGTDSDWTAIAAGDVHSCGIRGGKAYCFGSNASGQLGYSGAASTTPVQVGTATDWSSISTGLTQSCGIRSGGRLFCWGGNTLGELGNGTTTPQTGLFELLPAGWTKVTAGRNQTCAIRTGGALWCWGENAGGALGLNHRNSPVTAPAAVFGTNSGWTDVSLHQWQSCGIRNGFMLCTTAQNQFTQVGSLNHWTSLTMSAGATCGVESGALYCWGSQNSVGNLGTGDTIAHPSPTRIGAAFSDWTFVDSQPTNTQNQNACALRQGMRYCWGFNSGSYGDNTTANSLVPKAICGTCGAGAVGTCPNGTGPCNAASCLPGLTCGYGLAERFGLPAGNGVCWDPSECATLQPPDCGGPDTTCGACCVPDCGAVGSDDGCGHLCSACVTGADSDGDGLTDCSELSDSTRWTNPLIFNGVAARQGPMCHAAPSCAAIDSQAEVTACAPNAEEGRLRSGWSFSTSDDNICDQGFDFDESWSSCRSGFAVQYASMFEARFSGRHCFELAGSTAGQCASIFIQGPNVSGSTITNAGPTCLDLTPGVYALEWFYETTGSQSNELEVQHCFGGTADCNPSAPIGVQELRPPSEFVSNACREGDACSELCPCGTGEQCNPSNSNGFCQPWLRCVGQGAHFGLPAGTNVCWDLSCNDQSSEAFVCGTEDANCGSVCPACTASCAGKSCGSDGCWGSCGAACDAGEGICETDADCAAGLVCLARSGGRFGLAATANVCVPAECRSIVTSHNPCLITANQDQQTSCGVCPHLEGYCLGRFCGPNGAGGNCGTTPQLSECLSGAVVPIEAHVSPSPLAIRPQPEIETAEVGTIPGQLAVTPAGDATYSVALRLPPGRGGLTPSLGLSYSSGRGNGFLGVGWALDGMQSITRCNRTIAQDGRADSIHFDDGDAYCLNGERLVPIGEQGEELEFAFEHNDFSGIVGHRAGASAPYKGIESFEVTRPDGRVLTFGGEEDARILGPHLQSAEDPRDAVHTWALSRITDRSGNYATVRYDQFQRGGATDDAWTALTDTLYRREYIPRVIQYSMHEEDPTPQATILLDYDENRSDPLSVWRGGANIQTNRRLSRITILADRQNRRYQLDYDEGGTGEPAQSRLTSIRECVSEDFYFDGPISCLPPTTFEYERGGGMGAPLIAGDASNLSLQAVLDFNGDGKDDMLMLDTSDPASPVAVLMQSTTPAAGTSASFFVTRPIPDGPTATPSDLTVIDWDNDGHDDLLDFSTNTVYRSIVSPTGGRFARIPLQADLQIAGQTYVIDVDGDGRKDLLNCQDRGRWQLSMRDEGPPSPQRPPPSFSPWRLVNASTGHCPSFTNPSSILGPKRYAQAVDIDGDGSQELLFAFDERVSRPPPEGESQKDAWTIVAGGPYADPFFAVMEIYSEPRRTVTWQVMHVDPQIDEFGFSNATVHDTNVPWNATVTDANGDGLPDFFLLDYCLDSDENENCNWPEATRAVLWTNHGGTFNGGDRFARTESAMPMESPWRVTPIVTVGVPRPDNGNFVVQPYYRAVAGNQQFPSGGKSPVPLGPSTAAGAAMLARTIDYDGDGMQDILMPGPEQRWILLHSHGDGYDVRELDTDLPWESHDNGLPTAPVLVPMPYLGWGLESPITLDLNGDGILDFVKRTWAGADTKTSAGSSWQVLLRTGPSAPRLVRVTDGLGKGDDIDYALLTDSVANIYSPNAGRPCDYPQSCTAIRRSVVSAHRDGRRFQPGEPVDVKLARTYLYGDGRTDLWGRGFVGFASHVVHVVPGEEPSDYERTIVTTFDNETREPNTNLYYKAFAPEVTLDQRRQGSFVRTTTTTATYEPLLYQGAERTLHRIDRMRREVTSEHHVGEEDTVLRDWTVATVVDDKYGNPKYIVEGITDPEIVTPNQPEGLRATAITYTHEGSSAFDEPGYRNLPETVGHSFVLGPYLAPWSNVPFLNDRHTGYTYFADGTLRTVETESGPSDPHGDKATLYRKVELTRDEFGNVTHETESALPEGTALREREYVYPESGYARGHFPIEMVNEKNQHTALEYDRRYGAVTRVTDQNGVMTDRYYDDFGRLVRGIEGDSTVTAITYRAGSDPHQPLAVDTRMVGGIEGTTSYDVHGRAVQETIIGAFDRPLVSDTVFDDLDRVISSTRPHRVNDILEGLTQTAFRYDALNRVVRSEWTDRLPDGALATVGSDGCYDGLTSCTRNARGFTSCKRVDRVGRVTATWDPPDVDNQEQLTPAQLPSCDQTLAGLANRPPSTTYGYGEVLEKVTDPTGNYTRIYPDRYGRTLALSDPSTGVTRSTWNAFDELVSTEDAEGQIVNYGYDPLGRQILRRDVNLFGPGEHGETRWYYDGEGPNDTTVDAGDFVGAMSASVSPGGVNQRFHYDELGQLRELTQTLPGGADPLALELDDYRFGRPNLITYPAAGSQAPLRIRRNYDGHGIMTSVQREGSSTALWSLGETNAYDLTEREATADGITTTYTPDTLGRILSIVDVRAGATLRSLELEYDLNSNVRLRSDGTQIETYQYDELDRLDWLQTTTNGGTATQTIGYDSMGNITSKTGVGAYDYNWLNTPDRALNLNPEKPYAVSHAGTTAFEYSATGSMKKRTEANEQTTHYGWTPFGKIAQIWRNAESFAEGDNPLTLTYDADQNRVGKEYGGRRTTYLGGLYEKRTASSGAVEHVYYVSNDERTIAQYAVSDGDVVSESDLVFFHTDHLGSVELLTDSSGAAVESQRSYTAFGEPRSATNWLLPVETWSTVSTGFTGHERDDEYGLTHMLGRHYDPKLGRFMSADPFVFSPMESQGLNRFSYVKNNPLSRIDPDGFDGLNATTSEGSPAPTVWVFTEPTIITVPKIPEPSLPKPSLGDIPGLSDYLLSFLNELPTAYDPGNPQLAPNAINRPSAAIDSIGRNLGRDGAGMDVGAMVWAFVDGWGNHSDLGRWGDVRAEESGEYWDIFRAGTIFGSALDGALNAVGESSGESPSPLSVGARAKAARGGAAAERAAGKALPERGPFYVDSKGNAIPTPKGGSVTGSPDGRFVQARDAAGNPTGVRIDGPHRPATHPDPRAQQPHGHVPGVTNPDGTPWLPIR